MIVDDGDVFDRLLANCDHEPIQIPGAIQPHGVLVAVNESTWIVQQLSANADVLFGRVASELVGQDLDVVLGTEQAQEVRNALAASSLDEVNPLTLAYDGKWVDCTVHRHDGMLMLEIENPGELNSASMQHLDRGLGRTLRRLQGAKSLAELYEISVREIQALTGYDRVLIYRFEEEGHGQVIAEASSPGMDTYNGLFFPASDIPSQARELYRLNWLRIIPDARYMPVPLVPLLRPDTLLPLDMTHSLLRSVSPIHCQYMKNMGVLSSMSISLLKDDRLWGLISCGNRTPLLVPHGLRAACQTIGQVLSMQISALEEAEVARQRQKKEVMLTELVQAMRLATQQDVLEALAQSPEQLMVLTGASGIAVLVEDRLHTWGACPSDEQIQTLYAWVKQQPVGIYESSSLSADFPDAHEYQDVASGLLSFTLPKPVDNAVLWFRPEVKESVNWSGDPSKPMELSETEAGSRLQPRKSFEIWKEQVDGKAHRWSAGDLFAAADLRRSALEADLARQVSREQDAVRARDDLVAVVSHDLRSPMTVIVMQCGMMQRLIGADSGPSSKRVNSAIDTMQRATTRMTNLLEDLLDTSKIEAGRYSITSQRMDVSQIFEEGYSLLAPLALNKFVELSFVSEPDLQISADPERLFQVLSNLVGNAIKFTPREGSVGVKAVKEGSYVRFSVTDTGAGIAPEHLPHVFERYWRIRQGNPSGTGLGLYISMGIVKAHGGDLWVRSELGHGSEFSFTVPLVTSQACPPV
ncbi:ATP-binding protein [Pseudomonas folii]|uniref:histidine kinase n=1 Tax=Pseudomonas folii TaxID=2762593 RepID=A0ABR7AW31_9PSED|nr:ATP-binding protein [Pseudomonas folii]MBC3949123.1 GAF domain-containing protein [Pseudomonas folii]